MAMKKLPIRVQENLGASTYISSFKRAVEELVYNALDAESSSVAVRINVEENSIQVIDNGIGIVKTDFALLGQRYATSKCMDVSTLKSAPNKYGFRGLSLASLIEVSEKIKITSRCEGTEDTWLKVFKNGKQCNLSQTTQRPSKGTTVEIKGFLYNLKIRKNALDPLSELNRIKTLLEQLSLVHSHVSLSLRNDSTNEIVFKVHKNRDTYQTIETLLGIDKKTLQEFKVEKNEYKVTAFISKNSKDTKQYHWIYLNGKIVRNSKLQKIVNDNFAKVMKLNQNVRKCKLKIFEKEMVSSKSEIPTYFIFLTCPNSDFDVSHTPNQKSLEFKNWEHVTKIIEKLAKFYVGDINLETVNAKRCDKKIKDSDTRNQVKQIIKKILGSGPKKPAVSQMKKCVKGKLIKRKHNSNKKEDKNESIHISISKVLPPTNLPIDIKKHNRYDGRVEQNVELTSCNVFDSDKSSLLSIPQENKKDHVTIPETCIVEVEKSSKGLNVKSKNFSHKNKHQKNNHDQITTKSRNLSRVNKLKDFNLQTHYKIKNRKPRLDRLAQRFEGSLTESTKKRCKVLEMQVEEKFIKLKDKPKCELFVQENIQYSNIIRNNKSVSIRKKVDEIVIHNYPFRSPNVCSFDNRVWGRCQSPVRDAVKSYDLLRTVLNTQHEPEIKSINNPKPVEMSIPTGVYSPTYEYLSKFSPNCNTSTELGNLQSFCKSTYQSHNYDINCMKINNSYHYLRSDYSVRKGSAKKERFITTASRDNFLMPQNTHNFRKSRRRFAFKNKIPNQRRIYRPPNKHSYQSSVTIEFSTTKSENSEPYTNYIEHNITFANHDALSKKSYTEKEFETYTINKDDDEYLVQSSDFGRTYTVSSKFQDVIKCIEHELELSKLHDDDFEEQSEMNIVFFSESQEKRGDEMVLRDTYPQEERVVAIQTQEPKEAKELTQNLFHEDFSFESFLCDRNIYTITQQNRVEHGRKNQENVSHHFEVDINNKTNEDKVIDHKNQSKRFESNIIVPDSEQLSKVQNVKFNFNLKNRFRFVPKGLSPIFENCKSKDFCDYILDKDYYANEIYRNFANEVQINSDIFEPNTENVKELHTKAIEKINNKVNKDHGALIFSGDSIKNATVLNQVDQKFIAAKMFSKDDDEISQHLVLFDQHAVDERIRLEKCLEQYIKENNWKSHTLDEAIVLKLVPDDIIYLQNYKEKFSQIGLLWTSSDNVVTINAIPEAILGNHCRPVEVVIKAVKDLILEQINSIKSQNGCLTLYPKSIMDLIFTEACRYAIKFGDKLSKDQCVELLAQLAECKTPFQCAHGRPVMAVLVDIKDQKYQYKVNFSKIQQFTKQFKKQ